MRCGFIKSVLASIAALALAGALGAQTAQPGGPGKAAPPAAKTPSAPAPVRDITGVWMIRNPPEMRAFGGVQGGQVLE
jgi:hypothetical protein